MSDTNASCKPGPAPRSIDYDPIDATESLTDLIDVLQRQSFTRRFEPQARIVASDVRPVDTAARPSNSEDSSK